MNKQNSIIINKTKCCFFNFVTSYVGLMWVSFSCVVWERPLCERWCKIFLLHSNSVCSTKTDTFLLFTLKMWYLSMVLMRNRNTLESIRLVLVCEALWVRQIQSIVSERLRIECMYAIRRPDGAHFGYKFIIKTLFHIDKHIEGKKNIIIWKIVQRVTRRRNIKTFYWTSF